MSKRARRAPSGTNAAPEPSEVPQPETWTGGPHLLTRAATVGLWLLLATGPAALVLLASASRGATEVPPPEPVVEIPDHNERLAVEEFATRLVVDWLQTPQGQEQRLEGYGLLEPVTLPEVPQTASFPAVTRAAEVETGLWSVTVGVTVAAFIDEQAETPEPAASSAGPAPGNAAEPEEPAVDPAEQADGPPDGSEATDDSSGSGESGLPEDVDAAVPPGPHRRYFQVSVEYRDGLLAAQTLPAAVPAPPVAVHSDLGYREETRPDGLLAETVTGFLSALLTGGDVSRYTATDSTLAIIGPPPYRQARLVRLRADGAPDPEELPADGSEVHILATVVATTHTDQEVTLQYPLTLTARPGQWEVAEIDPAALRSGGSASTP